MGFMVREAAGDDYRIVFSLITKELQYPDISFNDFEARFKAMLADDAYKVYVAETDRDGVAGFISTVRYRRLETDGDYVRILAMAVFKEYQDSLIGSRLLEEAEKFYKGKGVAYFEVCSSFAREHAHMFYMEHGYVKKSYCLTKENEFALV